MGNQKKGSTQHSSDMNKAPQAVSGDTAKKREIHIVCQKIRYFREKKGMEQKALAKELGIISNAVSNWENGRARPDLSALPKICQILGVSLEELFDMPIPSSQPTVSEQSEQEKQEKQDKAPIQLTVHRQFPNEGFVIETYRRLNKQHRTFVESMLEKLIDAEEEALYDRITETIQYDDALCAGFATGLELEGKGEPLLVFDDKVDPRMDCVFPVSGDSMEPNFHDGDLVMIERMAEGSELNYGEIGAFTNGNDAYIKIYSKMGLRSLNKRYKVIRFTSDANVRLIGRVLGVLDPDAIVSGEDLEIYERVRERMEEAEDE